jgi:hypothetical protein
MKMKKFTLKILAISIIFAGPGSVRGEGAIMLPGCDPSCIMRFDCRQVQLAVEAGSASRIISASFFSYVTRVIVFEGEVYVRSCDGSAPKETGQAILRNGQKAEFTGVSYRGGKYKKLYLPGSYATKVTVFEGEVYVRSYDGDGSKEEGQVILKNGQNIKIEGTVS